jgi:hypothetical protein
MTTPISSESICTPELVNKTAGLVHVKWIPPLDKGGGVIRRYSLLLASEMDVLTTISYDDLVYKDTGGLKQINLEENNQLNYAEIYNGPLKNYAIGSLVPDTTYFFRVAAINDKGIGIPYSNVFWVRTASQSRPSPSLFQPQKANSVTGGLIELMWPPPIDTGGSTITSYTINMEVYTPNAGIWDKIGVVRDCTDEFAINNGISIIGKASDTPIESIKNFKFRHTTSSLGWSQGSVKYNIDGELVHKVRVGRYIDKNNNCKRIAAGTKKRFGLIPNTNVASGYPDSNSVNFNSALCI